MTKRLRILYVEDNPAVRTVRTIMLERDGYEVIGVETAAAALRAMEDGPVDLAIVDYGLPDARGDEFVSTLKQRQPGLPVILVSGSVPESTDPAADAFLIKGEEPRELINTIARLLGKSSH